MSKHSELMAEKRTHLAAKRTELAHERNVLAHIRTFTTVTLFGIAFIGLSKEKGDFLYNSGVTALVFGSVFIIIAIKRSIKHFKEIKGIVKFFEGIIKFKFIK